MVSQSPTTLAASIMRSSLGNKVFYFAVSALGGVLILWPWPKIKARSKTSSNELPQPTSL